MKEELLDWQSPFMWEKAYICTITVNTIIAKLSILVRGFTPIENQQNIFFFINTCSFGTNFIELIKA